MIRILVADDHTVLRQGVKQIVSLAPDMRVTGEAVSGQEVLAKVLKDDYDIVLLDISMPGGSGLDTLANIKARRPELPVLILTMHPEEQYAVPVLRLGASGYLTKEGASDELLTAIRKVAAGGKYISQTLAEELASQIQNGVTEKPHQKLSDREYQILCLVASGKKLNQIAEELSLGKKTVSTYRWRLMKKMGMKNNAELTRYAVHNQLVQ